MSDETLPTAEEILEAHDELEELYDMKYTGARVAAPRLKLDSLIEQVSARETTYARAAELLRDLITAHYFEDGNKRTAWAVTVEYLYSNDVEPAENGKRVPTILRRIRRYEVDEIATWLETGEIDESRLDP